MGVPYNNLVFCNQKSCGCQKKEHDQKLKTFLTHVARTSIDMLISKKTPTDNTTGYKGVYLVRGKYLAKIVFQSMLFPVSLRVVMFDRRRRYYAPHKKQASPIDYTPITFVCRRPEGAYVTPCCVDVACRTAKRQTGGMDEFRFHTLRHTDISNLLSGGAAPKDIQELLGHSDVSTTMNVYAHSKREDKRTSARLLDKTASGV